MGFIQNTLAQTGLGAPLLTFIISLLPVLELRAGILYGVGNGLNPWAAMLISIVGNMLPIPFIVLFIRKIFTWMRRRSGFMRRVAEKLQSRAEGKWQSIQRFEFFALMIFVAIPLPGTGAWTGALIAGLMNMRMRRALPSIFAGVIIAGFLVMVLSIGIFKGIPTLINF